MPRNGNRPGGGAADSVSIDNAAEFTRQPGNIQALPRGKPVVTLTDQTTLLKGPFHLVQKNTHSAKPVEAYTYFESLYPAPR